MQAKFLCAMCIRWTQDQSPEPPFSNLFFRRGGAPNNRPNRDGTEQLAPASRAVRRSAEATAAPVAPIPKAAAAGCSHTPGVRARGWVCAPIQSPNE
jgi:hypothetical protein